MLRRGGYSNVVSNTDPRLAPHIYSDFHPDLVLLDLMMPHMDGFQVMNELKKDIPESSYLPILVLTADTTNEARNRALSLGANDFLTKPFDMQEVLLRIRNLLETRSLYLRLEEHQRNLENTVQARTKELRESLSLLENTAEEHRRMIDRLIASQRSAS